MEWKITEIIKPLELVQLKKALALAGAFFIDAESVEPATGCVGVYS